MIYGTRSIRSIRDVAWYMTNINILITLAFKRPPAENVMAINYPDNKKNKHTFYDLAQFKKKTYTHNIRSRLNIIYIYNTHALL